MSDLDDDRVQPALHAMLADDVEALRTAIDADPEIALKPWNGNTLLEWTTQPPHHINPAIVTTLIDAGSPVDRALNLAGCWNLAELCTQLLDAGANPENRADAGITPLESAALHGATRSADVLVTHGLHRHSLWLAAATGQLDLVCQWINPDGELLRHPGPYRPNLADVGHDPGPPATDDPIEIIAEALVYAGANNRTSIVDYLVAGGADINARTNLDTTALHLAIMFRNPNAVSVLLQRGVDPTIRDGRHDSDAAGWAKACLNDHPDSIRIAELLEAT